MQVPSPERTPTVGLRLLFHFVVCLLASILLTSLAIHFFAGHYGLVLTGEGEPLGTVAARMQLRFVAGLNNFGTWAIPALGAFLLTYGRKWTQAAGLIRPYRFSQVGNAVLVFLFGIPVVALAAYLNLQLDLPQWMVDSEALGNALLANVLQFSNLSELLVTLIVVAVIPAIGEELMFRGLLQGRLLRYLMGEPAAIWAAATLFSAIHLEFAGFLPRLLLGVLLGYSYRWTRSLYVPIVLHFLFNGLQVLNTYRSGEFVPDTEMDAAFGTLLLSGSVSLAVVLYLGYRSERTLRETSVYRHAAD